MKFRYLRYGTLVRPVIPIGVRHGDRSVTYRVLVDSGADICVFDTELAEALGITMSMGVPRELFGVGAKASVCYMHKVTIDVAGWPYEIEACFMKSVGGRVAPYGIVGQRGFFDHFVVKFDLQDEEVELKQKGK